MTAENPIAILLATYNGARFLDDQLESIAAQSYSNWHIVASDDGSTDETLRILERFSAKYPGKITVLNGLNADKGACGNFLFLMRSCVGKFNYFAFCDQDDEWYSNKLRDSYVLLTEMEQLYGPEVPCLVFTDAEVVDDGLNPICRSLFAYTSVNPSSVGLSRLLVQNPISGASGMGNASLLRLASKISDIQDICMHDYWVGLVTACFGEIGCVKHPTYRYRQHDENVDGAKEMSLGAVRDKMNIASDSLVKKRRQAARLLQEYNDFLPENKAELLRAFAEIGSKSFLQKVAFCFKNDVRMSGLIRNVGLLFYL